MTLGCACRLGWRALRLAWTVDVATRLTHAGPGGPPARAARRSAGAGAEWAHTDRPQYAPCALHSSFLWAMRPLHFAHS